MKCNLIVPGVPKCGTSSLHMYLDTHPDIYMSTVKEPHYFSRNDRYSKGSAWHDQLFPPTEGSLFAYYGESSTSYCYDSVALRRIKNDLQHPKIIVLLRNPVERLLSHYRWLWMLNLEDRSLLKAVQEEELAGYDVHKPFQNSGNYATYLRGSQYSIYVPLMEEIFGTKNIFLLNSKDLLKDPDTSLNKCFAFLEVALFEIKTEIITNQTKEKELQRTFGLDKVYKLLPRSVVDTFDPEKKIQQFVKTFLGKKSRLPPVINAGEIEIVSEMLASDLKFFNSTFRESNVTAS